MILDYAVKIKHTFSEMVGWFIDLVRSADTPTLLLVAVVAILVSVVMFKR